MACLKPQMCESVVFCDSTARCSSYLFCFDPTVDWTNPTYNDRIGCCLPGPRSAIAGTWIQCCFLWWQPEIGHSPVDMVNIISFTGWNPTSQVVVWDFWTINRITQTQPYQLCLVKDPKHRSCRTWTLMTNWAWAPNFSKGCFVSSQHNPGENWGKKIWYVRVTWIIYMDFVPTWFFKVFSAFEGAYCRVISTLCTLSLVTM